MLRGRRLAATLRIGSAGSRRCPGRGGRRERAIGQRITPAVAARAGDAAIAGAMPLTKNRYKVPLTRAMVERTIMELAG